MHGLRAECSCFLDDYRVSIQFIGDLTHQFRRYFRDIHLDTGFVMIKTDSGAHHTGHRHQPLGVRAFYIHNSFPLQRAWLLEVFAIASRNAGCKNDKSTYGLLQVGHRHGCRLISVNA